ncbi:hypothetical protein BJY04DRAFT_190178 [Aspergillus karnatakaensis]|uniref:uncharacterized protein n=1 Tax=Aspergillus karnatakaensis TaxID=1810916 RepID=UPI003CCE0EA9
MISLKSIILGALVATTLPVGTLARDCHVNDVLPEEDEQYTVTSPSQLGEFDGCTSISGRLRIGSAYKGSFILNGVTNFTGSIVMEDNEDSLDLEAIEMPDLLYIDSVRLPKTWGMRKLLLPRLERVESLYFMQAFEDNVFDLGALESAAAIAMAGAWTNISLPSLETIDVGLTIVTDPTWTVDYRSTPVEIYLPSLVRAQWVSVKGFVSRLVTNLEILGAGTAEPRGMEIHANYTNLAAVNLPRLKELHGELLIDGHVSSINLGNPQAADSTIIIRAYSPVEIYSGMLNAGDITLSGRLVVLNFVGLSEAKSLNIDSTELAQCAASLIDVYKGLHDVTNPVFCSSSNANWSPDKTQDYLDYYGPSYTPTPTPWTPTPTPTPTPRPEPALTTAERAAVISVCTVVGSIILVGIFLWRITQRQKERAAAAAAATPAPVVPVFRSAVVRPRRGGDDEYAGGRDEPPPPYSGEQPPFYEEMRK